MEQTAFERAQALLTELAQAAEQGTIVPARLPGQFKAIQDLLAQAADERQASGSTGDLPADMDAFRKQEAVFFGHAIHELRTPMTSIRGYSDMLNNAAMGALNDMQKQFVDTIRTNSRRMETLLTDVSDMNKLRAGTLRVNTKMDMFKNIAMMVEKAMTPLAESLGKTLAFDIPQGLPILDIDGELLAKAISKLVENGLRYTRENGVVTVRAKAQDKYLIIEIIDNGIGMSADELNRLGEVYYRSDKDAVRAHKGSGLGVPVAYGIIHLLGGSVSAQSEPDKGTTLTITLTGKS